MNHLLRFTSCVAALLFAGAASAGDLAGLSDIRCARMQCKTAVGADAMPVLTATGMSPALANSAVVLIVLDSVERVAHRERVTIGADGSFAADIPAQRLAPGVYRFGFVTTGKPATTIATGSFSVSRSSPTSNAATPASPGAAFFFRTFGLAIPGVAYTVDNYAAGTRTLVTSAGALTKSAVRINPDGTYVWNSSWDGRVIQGRWTAEKDGSIILRNGQEKKDWKMQRMDKPIGKAEITLWDQNSIWYHGTPLP
jgi:hypothetical protein